MAPGAFVPAVSAAAAISAADAAASADAAADLLVDLPMIRFHHPGSSVDYAGVRVCMGGGEGVAVEVMLDTGLTLEMMTPRLGEHHGLASRRTGIRGITAGGPVASGT